MRLATVLIVAFMVSGCAYPFARRADPQTATLVRELPPESALVLPPPGGPAVISVLERRYANAIEQSILLANDSAAPGENRIDAVFWGPADAQNVPADNRLKLDHSTVRDIQLEMIEAFPGIAMQVSTFYAQNGYGPFGYAVGRGPGRSTCIYAWQRVEPPRNRFGEPAGAGAIKLRVRLCRGNSSEEALLRVLYGITISGYYLPASWNPYGPAPAAPAQLGGLGAPMLPQPNGENPYYVDTPASRREGRVLPVAPAAVVPVRRQPATAASAYPSADGTAAGVVTVVSPIDPPLGMPSALPNMPAANAAPAPGAGRSAATAAPAIAAPATVAPAAGAARSRPTSAAGTQAIRTVPATSGAAAVVPVPAAGPVPLRPTTPATAAAGDAAVVPRPTLGAGAGAPVAPAARVPTVVVPTPGGG